MFLLIRFAVFLSQISATAILSFDPNILRPKTLHFLFCFFYIFSPNRQTTAMSACWNVQISKMQDPALFTEWLLHLRELLALASHRKPSSLMRKLGQLAADMKISGSEECFDWMAPTIYWLAPGASVLGAVRFKHRFRYVRKTGHTADRFVGLRRLSFHFCVLFMSAVYNNKKSTSWLSYTRSAQCWGNYWFE